MAVKRPQKPVKIDDLPDILTLREVAQLFRLSPLTLKRWEKRGKIRSLRINQRGDRRYRKDYILDMLEVMGYGS